MEIQAEETQDWEFLPALDRVAPSTGHIREGLPVFDATTGQIAFRVPSVQRSRALLALPEAGRFVVAGSDGTSISLTVFDGLTGEIEVSRPIEGGAADLEVDPRRGVFFVAHVDSYGREDGFIGVYDAQTLELMGRMVVPALSFSDVELALDESELFAVFGGAGSPTAWSAARRSIAIDCRDGSRTAFVATSSGSPARGVECERSRVATGSWPSCSFSRRRRRLGRVTPRSCIGMAIARSPSLSGDRPDTSSSRTAATVTWRTRAPTCTIF